MKNQLSLGRKLLVLAGLWLAENDLQAFGFPWKFDAWWVDGKVSTPVVIFWALGSVALIAPWYDRNIRFVYGWVMVGCATLAFAMLAGAAATLDAPIAKVVWIEFAFALDWLSLTGALALIATGLWPLKPFKLVKISYLEQGEDEVPEHLTTLIEYEQKASQ